MNGFLRYAAIDVGTNSTRLYLAERRADGFVELARELVITRLGRGVDRHGRLDARAIEDTVGVVSGYWERCRARGVTQDRVRVAATSAVRDAANREEFLAAVRDRTGLEAEVLSGEEEAVLSFQGATSDLVRHTGPFCILDIGGGSTELVVGEREVEASISLDIGSVRLTERSIRHDPPEPEEIRSVAAAADRALAGAGQEVHPERARTLVGLAGTITTLSAVNLGLSGYVREAIHHSVLKVGEVDDIALHLAAMTSAERRKLPAMPPGREDVIVAGAVILQRVMRLFGFDRVLVSESDILDGLVASIA